MGKGCAGCGSESCIQHAMRCNLCKMEFGCTDPQLAERLERHREYHRPRTATNAIIGECRFDVVDVGDD